MKEIAPIDGAAFVHVRRLFDRLVDVPPEERGSILDAESTDPAIRREVERLLEVHTEDDALGPPPAPVSEPLSWAGQTVGRYRLLRRHAVGGMGVVYEAEQESPRRRVALKLIRPERMTAAARARFRREAEALGRLQHPGIATVLESGLAADPFDPLERGEPVAFCAMEFIDGEPVTAWCRRTTPSIAERVRLLVRIAEAIEHAHVRGVVHRDLKPANILVGADGQPKVVDFGIALTTDDEPRHTADGALLGTLGWMSPEQLRGDEADARSDVYALGLLAYDVLAGQPAFSTEGRGVADAAQHLLEAEATPLGRHGKELAGDLELVVATAMAKDRGRRYSTAAAFAADLDAVLASRPVQARPPTVGYRLRRLVGRHRVAVAAAVAVVATMIGATVWATVAWRSEARAAGRARNVNAALLQLLAWADPVRAGGPKAELLALLDEAGRIGGELAGDDEVSYTLNDMLGQRYAVLGADDKAIEHFGLALACAERIHGHDSAAVASTLAHLGHSLRRRDRFTEAIDCQAEALRLRRDVLRAAPGEIAASTNDLGAAYLDSGERAKALPLLEDALRMAEGDPTTAPSDLASGYTNLALTYLGMGRTEDAIAAARKGSTLITRSGGDALQSALALSMLAGALSHSGHAREAVDLYAEALSARRRLLPANHPLLCSNRCNLGSVLANLGQLDEATRLLEENLTAERAAGESPSKESRRLAYDIARALHRDGHQDEAAAIMRSAEHDPAILEAQQP